MKCIYKFMTEKDLGTNARPKSFFHTQVIYQFKVSKSYLYYKSSVSFPIIKTVISKWTDLRVSTEIFWKQSFLSKSRRKHAFSSGVVTTFLCEQVTNDVAGFGVLLYRRCSQRRPK
eukprot:UN23081